MNTFTSHFSEDINGLIEQKHAMGYKYLCQEKMLKRFDAFCIENFPGATVLDKDVVTQWAILRKGEHPATLESRVSPINELAKFIIRRGEHAYILPKGMLPKKTKYTPYIFGDEELKRLFSAIDNTCQFCYEVPLRHIVLPVFFRLLYCCGLRVSEARLMKLEDVNLKDGVITLVRTKFSKHRQVPLSPELRSLFNEYSLIIHATSRQDDWFFPGLHGEPMTVGNVNRNFRRFLWNAGISHCGKTKIGERGAPNVHSLRHTFAVNCLRKWMKQGKNTHAYLPVLQAFMGHTQFSDTAYYLHFSTDMAQDIRASLEEKVNFIIPSVLSQKGGSHEESD
jgi:integrase